jgi:hypothetical protein
VDFAQPKQNSLAAFLVQLDAERFLHQRQLIAAQQTPL